MMVSNSFTRIEEFKDIKVADHLRVPRQRWMPKNYNHFIVISPEEGAIRFKNDLRYIEEFKLEDFRPLRQKGKISRVEYTECLPAEETVKIAKDMLTTQPVNHSTEYNCEIFAIECKTGKKCSLQKQKLGRICLIFKYLKTFLRR